MNSLLDSTSLADVYKSLFMYNQDACYAIDLEGNFILFNSAAIELTGYTNDEFLHRSFFELLHESSLEQTNYHFKRILEGNREKFTSTVITKSGSILDLIITAFPIYHDGKVTGIVGIAKDTTKKLKLEHFFEGQNKVLEMISNGHPLSNVLEYIIYVIEGVTNGGRCSILLTDETGNRLVSAAAPSLPSNYSRIINGLIIEQYKNSCGTADFSKKSIIVSDIENDPLLLDVKELASSYHLKACWSSPVADNSQQVLGVFVIYYEEMRRPTKEDQEIIEKANYLTSLAIQHYRSEEKINFLANHDLLTNLPNRTLFHINLEKAINEFHPETADHTIALLHLDLDRFKSTNDTLGHRIGDILLKEVSNRIRDCLSTKHLLSRQVGDEFVILLTEVTQDEIRSMAQRVINHLAKPFLVENHEIFITVSIGISQFPFDSKSRYELIRKADIAKYQAKIEGRNNYQFYNAELDRKLTENVRLENDLRKALERDELQIHYQPIVELTEKKMVGLEALLRWEHPTLGFISPYDFIPIAEESGLIVPIGEWVIKSVCQQIIAWEKETSNKYSVSVNLSIRQFYQSNLVQVISESIKETGIDPSQLTLEITESMTMDVNKATIILFDFKSLGVNISMDDFGTGYSSLSHLQVFPIDFLKIDQSFIREINTKSEKRTGIIAATILAMAQNLGLKVIAEGVETKEQLQFLEEHGCNYAQGYYFSKPQPVEMLKEYMK
ncbi:bifunctional diguanylate cyclase/phosphodiesterase [Anaerobacillus alkaliphilus]|nr:EAL domain-containing protein [Anaerobacillus alkaliphilus]